MLQNEEKGWHGLWAMSTNKAEVGRGYGAEKEWKEGVYDRST